MQDFGARPDMRKCEARSKVRNIYADCILAYIICNIINYRDLDYGHILNGVYRQVHGLMMRIVAYEFDISFFL